MHGVDVLVPLLSSSCERVQQEVAWVVVNLSATTEHEAALIGAGALAPLVGLLSADSPGTQKQAARALANLSVNEEHKHTIIELGALEALRDMHASPVEETKEASHYLCHRHISAVPPDSSRPLFCRRARERSPH